MEKLRKLVKNKWFYVLSIIIICLVLFGTINSSKTLLGKYVRKVFKLEDAEYSYKIEYYYYNSDDGIYNYNHAENKSAKDGTVIENYEPDYSSDEYSTIAILNLPLKISEDEANNIIKIYYADNSNTGNNGESTSTEYKIEYYYNGDMKYSEENLPGKVGSEISRETIIEKINAHSSIDGTTYRFYKLGKDSYKLSADESKNTIKVTYLTDSADSRYIVDFYYDEEDGAELDPSKTRVVNANLGDTIIVESNPTIQNWISENSITPSEENAFYDIEISPEELMVSDDLNQNTISITYKKQYKVEYNVEFYYNDIHDEDLDESLMGIAGETIDSDTEELADRIEANQKEGFIFYELSNESYVLENDNSNTVTVKVYYLSNENIVTDYKIEYYYDGELREDETLTGEVNDIIDTASDEFEDRINSHLTEGYIFYGLSDESIELKKNAENTIKVYYLNNNPGYIIEFSYFVDSSDGGSYIVDPGRTKSVEATNGTTVSTNDIAQSIIEANKNGYLHYMISPASIEVTDDKLSNIFEVKYTNNLEEIPYIIEYYYDGVRDNSESEVVKGNEGDQINENTISSYIASHKKSGYKFYNIVKPIILSKSEGSDLQILQICYLTDQNNKYQLEFYYLQNGNEVLDIIKTKIIPINTSNSISQDQIQTYIDENCIESYKFDRMAVNSNVVKIYYTNIYNYKIEFYYNGVKDTNRTLTYSSEYGTTINFNDPYSDEENWIDINLLTEEKETIESVIETNKLAGYKLLTIDSEILESEEFKGVQNLPLVVKNDDGIIKVFYIQDVEGYTELFYYNNVLDYSKIKKVEANIGSTITYELIESDVNANTKEGYEFDNENNQIRPLDPDNPDDIIEYPSVEEDTFIKIYYVGTKQKYRIDYYKNSDGNQIYTKMENSDEIYGRFEQTINYETIQEYINAKIPENYRLAKEEDFTEEDKETILSEYDSSNGPFNGVINVPLKIQLNNNENIINE